MVSHFSANQYEDAFNPKKLRNWTIPRKHKEHPSTLEGFTQIIANDRGHLYNEAPKSKESPWGTFMGTWDMPCKIPPARPSYTARSRDAAKNLHNLKQTSPLNNAVNGYKKFEKTKKSQTSPLERPHAPTPPRSNGNVMEPSAGAPMKKSPEPASKSPTGKSPIQQGECVKSPKVEKPSTPVRSPTPQEKVRSPTPRSVKSRSPRPASHLDAPDNRVGSACTV
ncbi:protein Flattop-like [Styela clava]